ncbi:MAG TPA: glycosyltransferase [Nitrospirae bacterium]|nr:hyaluronan synthase [bacterium BMS3Abin06]HDH13610.1 glycosyltransferase [Nitrospirota bacterium]HDZ01190.1 glycosyltransferase [Nitrospirota bacterium]
MELSIIILTYNGEFYLDEVLASIFHQKTQFSFEVIIIDSGSSDRSLEIMEKHPVRIHRIPNSDFGHGKTRNLGVKLSSGQYVVFLTQDATPANEYWLENLVMPLTENTDVAGTYSCQIPRPDCNPCEWRDIELRTPPVGMVKKVNFEDDLQKNAYEKHYQLFMRFSNVSSCIRKEVLDKMPFKENITMMEDQEWCKRAIEAGYTIIYDASSAVYHSHNHSLRMIYKRHHDFGSSLKDFTDFNFAFKSVFIHMFFESLCDFPFIIRQSTKPLWKLKWIIKSPFIRFAMYYGLFKGLQHG